MNKVFGIALILSLIAYHAEGAVDDPPERVGRSGLNFLKIGQGARPAAMGGAFTAISDGIDAIFWNPAGLTKIEKRAYTLSYTNWLVDTKIYSGAFAVKYGRAALGLGVIALDPGDVEETTIFAPNGTGRTLDLGDLAIGAAYAITLTDRFSFGTQFRIIRESLDLETINTFDFNVGSWFKTGFKSTRLAMSLRNLSKDITIDEQPFFVPSVFSIGGAMEIYGEQGDPSYATLSSEALFVTDFGTRVHVGAELWLANVLALRGGYKFNYDAESFSLGAGIKWELDDRMFTVDVSYTNFGDLLNEPIRISVGGAF